VDRCSCDGDLFRLLQWSAKREGPGLMQLPAKNGPFSVGRTRCRSRRQDSGAIVNGVIEKELNLDIAQRLDRLLQAQGVATVMTRAGDSFSSLAERAALTNRIPDCILVSIHFNGRKQGSLQRDRNLLCRPSD